MNMSDMMEVGTELLKFQKYRQSSDERGLMFITLSICCFMGSFIQKIQCEGHDIIGLLRHAYHVLILTWSCNGYVTSGKWLTPSGPCLLICRTGMLLYILKCPCECLGYTRCLINSSGLEKEVEKTGGAQSSHLRSGHHPHRFRPSFKTTLLLLQTQFYWHVSCSFCCFPSLCVY